VGSIAESAPIADPRASIGQRVFFATSRTTQWAALIGVALVIVVPFIYAVLGGFRDNGQIGNAPLGWPNPWVPTNYTEVLTSGTFWRQVGNSMLIAAITTFVSVSTASLAAFAFARLTFRGRDGLFTLFALGLLFPAAVAILPLYILVRGIGLLDNPLGVALPQAAFQLPLTIIILRPFFRAIPTELEDAALIDGCGPFGFFWRVLIPLSRPALATVAVLAVVTSWNAFLLPLVVMSNADWWTLPLGVTNFTTQYTSDTARILAFTVLAMIPALGFYVVAERQLVGGLTAGAVKG
jgi:raffinose/stachyose/melibiose transport system permease protein